jgi:hypothetical protein
MGRQIALVHLIVSAARGRTLRLTSAFEAQSAAPAPEAGP